MTDKNDVMHQGKTITQWIKDFNGEFTYDQLIRMVRGGVDLQKMLMLGLDEAEKDIDDKQLFKGEEFFFESEDGVAPVVEFALYDENGKEVHRNAIDPNEMTSVSLEYLSNCVDDYNDVAKAFPNSIHQTAVIYVDGKPLSNISSVRKAQLRRLIDNMQLNEMDATPSKEDEDAALNEGIMDVNVTVGDFKKSLARNLAKDNDKLMFRVNKQAYEVFDMHGKGGTFVIDLIPQITNNLNEDIIEDPEIDTAADLIDTINDATNGNINSSVVKIQDNNGREYDITSISGYRSDLYIGIKDKTSILESKSTNEAEKSSDYMNVFDLRKIGQPAYPNNKEGWMWDSLVGIIDGKVRDFNEVEHFKPDYPSEGVFFLLDGTEASRKAYEKEVSRMMNENSKDVNEGRNWRTGGYGGYGRTYQSYGELGAPRGKAISWFAVDELDPKARGKMKDWRVGPSNFPFKDLLYPNRKYKVGTTVLRSKFMNAGDESGVKYIAVPSYIEAIRNNDEAAIELLNALGIPLDLTFGYSPNEDFSSTYTTK